MRITSTAGTGIALGLTRRAALAIAAILAVAWLITGGGNALAPFMLGAVTLAQAAVLSENDLQAGVLETFVIESPVLDRLSLKRIEGNAYAYNSEATLPGVEFRAVNTAYAESTGTVNQSSETLTILGGDSDLDLFIQATRSNVNDQRAVVDRMKVKAAAYKFQDAFFNGDVAVDANSFDGLKKRTTGAQVIAGGTNGIPVVGNGGTDIDTFLDFLDALIMAAKIQGGNGAIYANDLIIPRIVSAARRKGLITDGDIANLGPIRKTQTMYRGIAVLDPGNKLDGSRILPQTETQGTEVAASSVYAVRFGEDEADEAVTGLFNGNISGDEVFDVRDLGELQTKSAYRTRVEGFVGLAVFGGRAVARGTGIRNA